MKKNRKLLGTALCCAAALSVFLTACGGQGKNTDSTVSGTQIEEPRLEPASETGIEAETNPESRESTAVPSSEPLPAIEDPALKFEAKMEAAVKEIDESSLLVSSRTDQYPGAYYVYFGDIDISGIKEGDEVEIFWDGAVLETSPAQIYAGAIEAK